MQDIKHISLSYNCIWKNAPVPTKIANMLKLYSSSRKAKSILYQPKENSNDESHIPRMKYAAGDDFYMNQRTETILKNNQKHSSNRDHSASGVGQRSFSINKLNKSRSILKSPRSPRFEFAYSIKSISKSRPKRLIFNEPKKQDETIRSQNSLNPYNITRNINIQSNHKIPQLKKINLFQESLKNGRFGKRRKTNKKPTIKADQSFIIKAPESQENSNLYQSPEGRQATINFFQQRSISRKKTRLMAESTKEELGMKMFLAVFRQLVNPQSNAKAHFKNRKNVRKSTRTIKQNNESGQKDELSKISAENILRLDSSVRDISVSKFHPSRNTSPKNSLLNDYEARPSIKVNNRPSTKNLNINDDGGKRASRNSGNIFSIYKSPNESDKLNRRMSQRAIQRESIQGNFFENLKKTYTSNLKVNKLERLGTRKKARIFSRIPFQDNQPESAQASRHAIPTNIEGREAYYIKRSAVYLCSDDMRKYGSRLKTSSLSRVLLNKYSISDR